MPVNGNINNMKDKYIITAALKGGDGKIHRLGLDLIDQTEGSVKDLILFAKYMDERCPKDYDQLSSTGFCIQKYKFDRNNMPEIQDQNNPEQFENLYNSIEKIQQNKTTEKK